MKTHVFLALFVLTIQNLLFSQTWNQKQNFKGNHRYGAVGFSIGDKGFIALGDDSSSLLKDIWEYNPANDSWKQKSDFIGPPRRVGIAFTIDSLAYVGAGWTGYNSYFDFYEYNPKSDSWTQKASYPGIGGRNCISTSIKGKGYVGGGNYTTGVPADDFWEYDPAMDTWNKKADLPFGPRSAGIAFSIDSIVYIGLGRSITQDHNDLWAFFPSDNKWKQLANFPGVGRLQAACFVLDGKAIVGGGFRLGIGTELSDYYEYDPITDNWSPVISFANGARSISVGFSIGQSGYFSTGLNCTDNVLNDLWEYTSNSSLNEQYNNIIINLYPIPNNGLLDLKYSSEVNNITFRLFNTRGRLIFTKFISGKKNHIVINLEELPAGNYYYQFIANEGMTSGTIPLIK